MDPELRLSFRRIPKELWPRHFNAIENLKNDSDVDPALVGERQKNYMAVIIEAREKAVVEFHVSDKGLQEQWPEAPEQLGSKLREAFALSGNLLGAGRTARVKSVKFDGIDKPIAVKYLLTPTEKTLSVDGEHDMLKEVETITKIEEAENRSGAGMHVRVPHPYFYFKDRKLQTYGMSEVNGVDIENLLKGTNSRIGLQDTVMNALRKRFETPQSREELWKEVDTFVNAMHEVCLHGDVKDKNIMVDDEGRFFLIDFGQSVPVSSMTEETRAQFDELKDEERKAMQNRIRNLVQVAVAAKA